MLQSKNMQEQQIELIHTPNYQQIKQNFLDELTLASQGKPSSIFFFKNHLAKKPLITKGIIQGIVFGGTNYIVATEEITPEGIRHIIKRETGVLPLLETKQIFRDFISKLLDPQADAVGFNFGFPLNAHTLPSGEIDGRLNHSTKEHAFKDLLHESIGDLIKTIYKEKYHKTPFVSVANDTVCLTLSGDGTENGAFVAGTGFNMCLAFQDKGVKTLVNLESGNFNKFTLSPILQKIDKESEVPEGQLFEKTVSGKYLAIYFNEKVKELKLDIQPISTSQELSELSHQNHTDIAGDLARAIITRSAFLVGSAIAGVYEFYGKPEMFTLIGEGSLLWDGWHYADNIKNQLKILGADAVELKHIPDSSINGAIGLVTYDMQG